MSGERWFRVYRTVFFPALVVTTLVRLYFISGFAPELADRGSGRLLGGFDVNLWVDRLGSAAWVLTLAAGAAIIISLAIRAYRNLDARQAHPPLDR